MLTPLSTLHIFDQWSETYGWHSLGHGLGSLADFERLHYLEIPVEILIGDADVATFRLLDVLPKSMIVLTLRNDLDAFYGNSPFGHGILRLMLRVFLEDTNFKMRLPNLRMLHLCFQIEHYKGLERAQNEYFLELSGPALAVGVELAQRYEYQHYSSTTLTDHAP